MICIDLVNVNVGLGFYSVGGNFPWWQLSSLGGHFWGVIFLGDSYPLGQLSGGAIIRGQLYGEGQFSVEASLRCFYSLNAHFQILNRLINYF